MQPEVLDAVWSPQLRNRRDVQVYLPPSYDEGDRRYPVVYMHDGQNLSDARTSFAGIWELDRNLQRLSRRGVEPIIVGIPNMPRARADEYSPFADPRLGGGGNGGAYLAFVADTLKPLVDRRYRTLAGRDSTGLLGSSMGGLISLYGFFQRPEAFGLAGAMSPSLWFAGRAIFPFVESAPFTRGRLYLDLGTAEGTVALQDVRRMRRLLTRKGYRAAAFRYLEDEGARHSEAAWARRLGDVLFFLLGGRQTRGRGDRRPARSGSCGEGRLRA